MVQAQFNLDESLWTFVQQSRQYGFQNQDELIRVALGKLQQELYSLEMSADHMQRFMTRMRICKL